MSKHPQWTDAELAQLASLVLSEELTYPEIAKAMGKNENACRIQGQRLGLVNPVYRRKIVKHQHLRGPVMRYFLTHTWEETRKHFNLSQSHLKSIFTVGYRDPKFAHLRKETRTHAPFTNEHFLKMVRMLGLISRKEIAQRLGRGETHHVVKDRLSRINSASKYMNGMPAKWARELWPDRVFRPIKTTAGPHSVRNDFRFKIIPWVSLPAHPDPKINSCIRSMAKFQKWIHGKANINFKRIINGK
jgi:hypothetical protein